MSGHARRTPEIVSPVPPSKRPAWKEAARALVLYNPKTEWRYAIYNDAGIIDGALLDAGANTSPRDAQALLLRRVEEDTGQRYVAAWTQDKPHWWSAELRTAD